ncbi:MAG: hypothetical protein ABDH59_06590 [Fervidobacterium sp.]
MADKAITLSSLDLKYPEKVEGFANIFHEFLIGGIITVFTIAYYTKITKQYEISSNLKSEKDLYYFHNQVWAKENDGIFMYGKYADEWPLSKLFDEGTILPVSLPLKPYFYRNDSGKLRLNIATHNPNFSDINTLCTSSMLIFIVKFRGGAIQS